MNLLFLNSIDEKTYGGMEEWIRLVALGLIEKGHSVSVCGRRNSEFVSRLNKTAPEIDVIELDISGDFNPVTISHIKQIIEKKNIDSVIVNFNKDIRLGGLAAKLSGDVKVIWSVGLDITKDKLIHKVLTPKLVDAVIVPSNSLRKQITRHGYLEPNLVEVIPIGIPECHCNISRTEGRKTLLDKFKLPKECTIAVTSGRFVEQKGHKYLIDAALKITANFPQVRFLFLGDGPLRPQMESQIEKLDLKNYFIPAGMVEEVSEFLPGCDLMIHPSIEEPFGIAILEGMRAGLPVIASRVGGIPEVIEENKTGLLVEPGEPAILADSVNRLLGDSVLLKQMGEAGTKRWQSQFSYEIMIKRIENYLMSQLPKTKAYGKAQADRA